MGCNYFARIIPTKERKNELCNLIQNSMDFHEIKDLVNKTYGKPSWPNYETETVEAGEIHLGKSSWGWKFLWNPNVYEIRQGHMEYDKDDVEHFHGRYVEDPSKAFKFYELTQKGLKEFIDREDVEIYDEYGELQDKEEFWDFTRRKDVDKDGNEALDAKAYEEQKIESRWCLTDYAEFLVKLGYKIEWPYYDFYSDGLRFATNTDFC